MVGHEVGAGDGGAIFFDDRFQQVRPTRRDGCVHLQQQGDALGFAGAREGGESAFRGGDGAARVFRVGETHPDRSPGPSRGCGGRTARSRAV